MKSFRTTGRDFFEKKKNLHTGTLMKKEKLENLLNREGVPKIFRS